MGTDLQKANMWKRMAAWLLDMILIAVLTVGAAAGMSAILGYNSASAQLEQKYVEYGERYGVVFDITQAEYDAMDEAGRANYDAAYEALIADEAVLFIYNKVVNLSLLITTFGILIGVMLLEFVVPLLLKNGQTIGKKCFGIGLIRENGVQMTTAQLLIRSLLGKFTVCTMLPAYILMLIFFGSAGLLGTIVLFGLLITQFCLLAFSRNNTGIPDQMAGTVQVDLASQKIFKTTEDLLEYTKRIHAERAKRQDY